MSKKDAFREQSLEAYRTMVVWRVDNPTAPITECLPALTTEVQNFTPLEAAAMICINPAKILPILRSLGIPDDRYHQLITGQM